MSWLPRVFRRFRRARCAWCGVTLLEGSAVAGYDVCSEEHASLYWETVGL